MREPGGRGKRESTVLSFFGGGKGLDLCQSEKKKNRAPACLGKKKKSKRENAPACWDKENAGEREKKGCPCSCPFFFRREEGRLRQGPERKKKKECRRAALLFAEKRRGLFSYLRGKKDHIPQGGKI